MSEQPDSPCIGAGTTLYDDFCKGCVTQEQKDPVGLRIETEGAARRFNEYKDRA